MTTVGGLEGRLITLFDGRAAFWVALAVALGVGAMHAVAPGHGKSVTAAYLVGTRGRYRDALRLGAIVAVMHTCSVLVLALAWVGLTGVASLGTEMVTAWMQVVAGLVVIGVGAHLTYRHLRRRGHSHHGHHHADAHDHGPGHNHGQGRDHNHDHAEPWTRRGLVALGLSGGLLPSPSAFIVLVSGLLTGRALGAVMLVLAFGAGMALTLTGVGVLTIRGHALLARGAGRLSLPSLAAWTPAVAGVAVSVGGFLYLAAAVSVLAA